MAVATDTARHMETRSSGERWERYAAAGGILFVVMVVVSILALPENPGSSAPAAELAAYYAGHHGADLVSDYWSFAGSIPFVMFLVALSGRLYRAGIRTLAFVALGAGLIGEAFELIATAIEFALASSVYKYGSPDLVKALYVIASKEFYVSNAFYAFFLAAASIALLRATVLARWVGGIGLAGAAAFILSAASIANPHGPLGIMLLVAEALSLLWILLTSVLMLRRPGRAKETGSVRSPAN